MGIEIALFAAVGLLVAIGAGAFARSRRLEAERARGVAERGWRYRRTPRGFAVEGGETVPWALTLTRPRSTGSGNGGSTHTLWEAPAAPTDAVVLLGPKLPAVLAGLDFGGSLVQLALRAVIGDRASDLADAHEVVLGSEAFRDRYTVLASSDELAASILTPEVEAALLAAPLQRVAVLRWRDRLQLRVAAGLWSADEIAEMVALGTTIAERCAGGAGSAS